MTKPDFIIGDMKSATSTLHEQFSLQEGFFKPTPKEPNCFSDDEVQTPRHSGRLLAGI